MDVHPLGVILAIIFMVLPLVLAVLIDRQVAAFQRQAFGHLAKAARNLRVMSWAVFAYYIVVLTGSWLIGDLKAIFIIPMPVEGVQIYVRIGAAILAYIFAHFVARELFLVTQPRKN